MLIDNNTIEQARNADIISFLEKYQSFTFAHRGDAYRCQQHPSLAVKADRRSFYWHSKSVGGFGVLDYLTKVEGMRFRDAVGAATSIYPVLPNPADREPQEPKKSKTLMLPEKATMRLKLHDYLCVKRGIDGDIVNTLIQEKMLYEDRRGNVVFVGYDEHNNARFASLRGTHGDCSFRMDCTGSDKRHGFSVSALPQSERLYIYESPIDLMSHASIENRDNFLAVIDDTAWREHNCLSLSGTSDDTALQFFLNKHEKVKELIFCLDNDPAGREAAVSMARKYTDKGYITRLELPQGKDFNEDLTTIISEKSKKYKSKNYICL